MQLLCEPQIDFVGAAVDSTSTSVSLSVETGCAISETLTTSRVLSFEFDASKLVHENVHYYPETCKNHEFISSLTVDYDCIQRGHSGGAVTGAFSRAFNDEFHDWVSGRRYDAPLTQEEDAKILNMVL